VSKYVLQEWLSKKKKELVERSGCRHCKKGRVSSGFERYWQDDPYRPHSFILRLDEKRKAKLALGVRILAAWQLPIQLDMTKETITKYVECCYALCRKCYDPRNQRRSSLCQRPISPPREPSPAAF
jgi:hypothetical protein